MVQFKIPISMRKVRKRWIFVFLTLAVFFVLLFLFASRALPKIAIAKIAKLTDTKIEAGSVDVNFNGSVLIKELVLRTEGSPNAKESVFWAPEETEKYNDVVFRARAVNVHFYPMSLLAFRPKLKGLSISDFIFNLRYAYWI